MLNATGRIDALLSHWLLALPIFLIVAWLGLRLIDAHPPSYDEFYAMDNAGWLRGPYSPLEVLQSLERNSSNQSPLHYLLLNLWGRLVGTNLPTGRYLAVLCALLAMAMAYRMTRDFVAPAAGMFALVIIAGNAFYNFYISYLRLYTLLAFLSFAVVWLYLRISHKLPVVRRRDYLALFAVVYCLLNTHFFSALLLAALGLHHLLFVPKTRRWLGTAAAAIMATALFSPWLAVLLSAGLERQAYSSPSVPDSAWMVLEAWLRIHFNGSIPLLALAIGGLFLGWRKKRLAFKQGYPLIIFYALTLALLVEMSGLIAQRHIRSTLPSLALMIPLLAAAHFALYRWKRPLILLLPLWIVAGLQMQSATKWTNLNYGSLHVGPPWHAINRDKGLFGATDVVYLLTRHKEYIPRTYDGYTPAEHYFGIDASYFRYIASTEGLTYSAWNYATHRPGLKIAWDAADSNQDLVAELDIRLGALNYRRCGLTQPHPRLNVAHYSWKTLRCQPPQIANSGRTALIEYAFYGTLLEKGDLFFVDQWEAADFNPERHSMSYQLIDADLQSVAQLDLPLVHEGSLRQFSIDISGVPPGSYRLMAILYDNQTGETVDWIDNPGWTPQMLALTDVEIPE